MCVVLVAVIAGCSASDDASQPTDPSRSSAPTASSTAPDPVVCNGVDEFNQDDDGAVEALLPRSALGSGEWTTADMPPCPWALSADEILAVPQCRAAAASAEFPANDDNRNGNARVAYTRSDGVQVDDRIEIYTSRQNVDAIRAILAGPSMPKCYSEALRQHATADHRATVDDVSVTTFVVEPDAAALGLGFPATEGYAADPGFARGVGITFTNATGGSSTPTAMRVITFGSGGLMSTLTLIGTTPAELEAVDLSEVLRAAAGSFSAMFGPRP
jgi:hypothetical protein